MRDEKGACGVVAFYNNWEEIFVFFFLQVVKRATRSRNESDEMLGVCCGIIIIINISNERAT
jgi:hypothetical protein